MRTGYDLIVVGHNLTDLATAALASKQGLKTLLIEIDGRDSPTALEGAPPLPFAADSLIDVQSLREILSILEIESPLTVRRPILQVLFPDRRIDIASDRFPLEAEMEREFGQSPSLAALYDSARELSELIMERWQNIASPKNGTPRSFRRSLLPLSIAIKRRQFKELMRKASADSHIRSFLAAQVIENTRFIPAASDPLASALGVAIPFLEIGEITAGTVQLRDILLQNIETNNGAVL